MVLVVVRPIIGESVKVSSRKKPRYQQRLTLDANGRLRIGGRFASPRQVSRWRTERRKRGLPSDAAAPRKRVQESAEQKLARLNFDFAGVERFNERGSAHYLFNFDDPSKANIEKAVKLFDQFAAGRKYIGLITVFGVDAEDSELVRNTRSYSETLAKRNPEWVVEMLVKDIRLIVEDRYQFETVTQYQFRIIFAD